jgi:hypothetical protein
LVIPQVMMNIIENTIANPNWHVSTEKVATISSRNELIAPRMIPVNFMIRFVLINHPSRRVPRLSDREHEVSAESFRADKLLLDLQDSLDLILPIYLVRHSIYSALFMQILFSRVVLVYNLFRFSEQGCPCSVVIL